MAIQLNEKEIFHNYYASLCDTLTDVDHLQRYFVQEKIINLSDVEEITKITPTPKKVEKLLLHISGPLVAGDTKGFYTMLIIMKEHGNLGTKNLAVKMGHELMLANNKPEDEG